MPHPDRAARTPRAQRGPTRGCPHAMTGTPASPERRSCQHCRSAKVTQVAGSRSASTQPAAQGTPPSLPGGPRAARAAPGAALLRPEHRLQEHSYAKQPPNKGKKPCLGVLSAIAQRSGAPESVINPKAHAKQSPTDSPRRGGTRLQAGCHTHQTRCLCTDWPVKVASQRAQTRAPRRGLRQGRWTLAANPRQGAGRPTPRNLAQVRASSRLRATLYRGQAGALPPPSRRRSTKIVCIISPPRIRTDAGSHRDPAGPPRLAPRRLQAPRAPGSAGPGGSGT